MRVDIGLGYELLSIYRQVGHRVNDSRYVLATWKKGSRLDSRELVANKINIAKVNQTLVDYELDTTDTISLKASTLSKLGNCIESLPCFIAVIKRAREYNWIGFKLKELVSYLSVSLNQVQVLINQLITSKVLYRDRYSLAFNII